ncbi:GNAT family N-acetyltransferase [Alkalicoccus halolimnae]|nr:GNAT family N-acetyltransferase [Alkalicoccus halolimnae]
MKQLRTHLTEEAYTDLVKDAREKDRYQLYAMKEEGEIKAVIGFKPMITLYYGHFVWVCDLVTDGSSRSSGYGEKLLDFVHQWTEKNEYTCVALSSGLNRSAAHRFYEEKMAYDKVSYVFKKDFS